MGVCFYQCLVQEKKLLECEDIMDISPTDKGGRRIDGNRRLVNFDNLRVENRSIPDRRIDHTDKRSKKNFGNDSPERRAADLFFREKIRFTN